jgi:hypothetical protein
VAIGILALADSARDAILAHRPEDAVLGTRNIVVVTRHAFRVI